MSDVVLKARGLTKRFHEGRIDLTVLHGVDLDVRAGETLAIVGASGSGKSTLLHLMGGLDGPTAGRVELLGKDIAHADAAEQGRLRNEHLGFVYQFHHLLPEFSAMENICIPAFIAKTGKKEAEQRAMELLDLLGLKDRATHKPNELSGGEQQRIAVARALVNKPSIILADEPSGNLDSANANALHEFFISLRDNFKQTFVIVTHNEGLAKISDRVVTMKDGLII